MSNLISIIILEEVKKFLDGLDDNSKKKVFYNFKKTELGFKGEWFQKMSGTNDIWEFRTLFNGKYIRVLAFFSKDNSRKESIVVCTNGFIKKEGRTSVNEIRKAELIRRLYKK